MRVVPPECAFRSRASEGNHFSVVHDGDAIAKALGLLDVMRGHHDGFLFAPELFDDVVDFPAHLGIQSRQWLIEKKYFRSFTERHGRASRCFWPPESWL